MNSEGPGSITSAPWWHITNAKGLLRFKQSCRKNRRFYFLFFVCLFFLFWSKDASKLVFTVVHVCAERSIRKQEAAAMLGNGDDFHLGDEVIVAMLSLRFVGDDDGWFLCLHSDLFSQLSRGKEKRKKKTPAISLSCRKSLNSGYPAHQNRFCTADELVNMFECVLARSQRRGSKQTLTWASRTCPLSPFTHSQSWPNGIPLT